MKNISVFLAIFVPIFCFGQVNETFLYGNFINNPIWTGTSSNFFVNPSMQLQSKATVASTSYLFTPSEAIDDATWECWVKINYNPSSSNYASIYLVSDKNDLTSGCNGYYVQIGGTNDEVSLFVQEGTTKTKIIDGVDKRTDRNPVDLRVKVTRDADGNFALYSKLASETDYVLEGTTQNTVVKNSNYFGLLYVNTASTGSYYFFDDILVTGNKAVDKELPIWNQFNIEAPNQLKLGFSEAMNFSASTFTLDNGMGSPVSTIISADKTSIELTFATDFQKGKVYTLQTTGMTDLAGNQPELTKKSVGIVEKKEIGDLIFNEVMFENPETSLEYIEIYNKSDKLLDVSGMIFTTRKTDGTMNTGVIIPKNTSPLPPKGYLAICSNAETVRSFHACPAGSNIISTSWSALNNETSTLVFTSAAKDSIFDELKYDVKWHNSWVTSPKGIALERTSPDLSTQDAYSWHSSTAVGNNGTPGYQNSVYVDTDLPIWNSIVIEQPNKLKLEFSERMNFSASTFTLDNGMGNPVSTLISSDKTSIELTFGPDFQKGKIYNLQTSGLTDLAGNQLELKSKSIGIIEKKEVGDLIFNEVMFENPETSFEYIEIYNKSDKLLDVSGMVFTTRKADGTMNTGVIIPQQTHIQPHGYIAFCSDAELLRSYHSCPVESNIISTEWNSLNNESAVLVLTNSAKDSIFDELQYNVKWHNALVKNPKGVSLERINSNLVTQDAASWHSAASTTNFGTPGYQNSQFRDLLDAVNVDKFVWTEPESFSPDNDGVDDVCIIKYKTDATGYVANVMILNAVGAKVAQLGANILLPTEGFLIWDGKTGSGKNANVGIYVLYFEMFNPNTGARKHRKLPIVVSSL